LQHETMGICTRHRNEGKTSACQEGRGLKKLTTEKENLCVRTKNKLHFKIRKLKRMAVAEGRKKGGQGSIQCPRRGYSGSVRQIVS